MTSTTHAPRTSARRLVRAAFTAALLAGTALVGPAGPALAAPPTPPDNGPTGWDVYRRLDRLAELPDGPRAYQFSSFDRAGGNDDGFSGQYSCLRTGADGCVLAEAAGAGEIDSIWFTRDEGDVSATGTIKVVLDGVTVLDAKLQDVVDGKLGAPFVYPVVANGAQSSGGVYIKAPMTYRSSMRVTTEKNPIFYHVTYRKFTTADGVRTFDPSDRALDVIDQLKAAGTSDPKRPEAGATTANRQFSVPAKGAVTLASGVGPGAISALQLRIPQLVGPPTPVTDDGRAYGSGGGSEFQVAVDPANAGVRLTRRLDPHIGHQRAQVLVDGVPVAEWPANEMVPFGTWLDQSVDLPASATAGKSTITIRNQFASSDLDINEFTYWVDSLVGGTAKRTDTLDLGPSHTDAEAAHSYRITKQSWQGSNTMSYPADADRKAAVAASDAVLRDSRLRITFDGETTVDAPLGEFFGTGLGLHPVRSLMFGVDPETATLSAWWPMPYRSRFSIELRNGSGVPITTSTASVTTARSTRWASALRSTGTAGYFRATATSADTTPGADHPFIDVAGRGKFVGVTHTMEGHIPAGNQRNYLEGDERVYVDGAQSPSIHGTGTEDFYESGWYFNHGTFSAPTNGNPAHEVSDYGCQYDCTGAYRLMLAESVSFATDLRFGIEHGPGDQDPARYGSTAYWYGQDTVGQRWTDTVDVGDAGSESAHAYSSDGKREVLTATFEGDDGAPRPVTDDTRASTTPIRFKVALDPHNTGAVLRRVGDQSAGYQSVAVQVDGRDAGTWSQPLANGSHRWLEDEFRLPPALTHDKSTVTVTLRPTAGAPAWSAARYAVLSEVTPFVDQTRPTQVTGLTATSGTTNAVALTWRPATDDVYAPTYEVFASRKAGFTPGPENRVGVTTRPSFEHSGLSLRETWHYRVRAVDAAGNLGPYSAPASATTGDTLRIEAESLLPAVSTDAPAEVQGDCCGIHWSRSAQLWFRPDAPNRSVTVAFEVPTTGTYQLHLVQTLAGDYGTNTVAIDGSQIGEAFDAYHSPGVIVSDALDYGQRELSAGRHTLTLTVTGKAAAASGYLAGLDYVEARLTS
ncbi:hypothetical protein JOD64_005701 [Micromonospora luteifusca]|uniref:Fibronectin type-III domain-containing protein n=1 Tax=Micromonospora luteifusca TaxID=709860 RepID=A0ABS2M3K4_9ACTN|nr:DUF2961 domain-containing protein [Micromonospora luteifusca]MBM7494479.1 hypothetical protein [Micromonospora luteifusca]